MVVLLKVDRVLNQKRLQIADLMVRYVLFAISLWIRYILFVTYKFHSLQYAKQLSQSFDDLFEITICLTQSRASDHLVD